MIQIYLSMLETPSQQEKFERIYEKYHGFSYREAYRIVKDENLAEDVVHEVFVCLIKKIDILRADNADEMGALIKLITHDRAVDFVRKWYKETPVEHIFKDDVTLHESNIETVALNHVVIENAVQAIQQMDIAYRAPFELKISGYSIREIADLLDISESNVKVRIHRARKKIFASLGDSYERF